MSSQRFNAERFYQQLDNIFANKNGHDEALHFLESSLLNAEESQDLQAELSVISEFLGYDRSHGRHEHSRKMCERALDLRNILNLANTQEGTIIAINIATAYRQSGDYELAEKYYRLAIDEAKSTLSDTNRYKAALYNNFSMLLSETGNVSNAREQLQYALKLMQQASADPDNDPDIATTLTNLGLLDVQLHDTDNAVHTTQRALDIYQRNPELQETSHYPSALAGYAQALFMTGQIEESLHYFKQATSLIKEYYGESSDYYKTTYENMQTVQQTLRQHEGALQSSINTPHITGLQLSESYWKYFADTLFSDDLLSLRNRTAVGLVGHGSECYGFDDELSRDHDFGARFCLWLSQDDFHRFGTKLQQRYELLPNEFQGITRSSTSPRGHNRDGVMTIDMFFESLTGMTSAPAQNGEEHLWLSLSEETLATATNGKIFADPAGNFSSRRQGFKKMPDDVRLYLISQRLGMIAQTGQYNLSRMTARNDYAGASLTIHEFAMNVSSLIFLLNNPVSVGYAPYYKWRFAALRRLSTRMGTRLSDICEILEKIVVKSPDVNTQKNVNIICSRIVDELYAEGLTTSKQTFLEWQRPYIESHITSRNPILHSI